MVAPLQVRELVGDERIDLRPKTRRPLGEDPDVPLRRIDQRDRIPQPRPHLDLGKGTLVEDVLNRSARRSHLLTKPVDEVRHSRK